MLFSSLIFLFLFLPAVLAVYYLVLRKHRQAQNIFLLLASLGFYAWGEPWFVLVLLLSITVNWAFGLLMDKTRTDQVKSRWVISAMLLFNLMIIFIFKYLMFTVDNLNRLFGLSLEVARIALPIGISFFTFQAISYVLDIYYERGKVQKNPLNVGLYIVFFPQLIAGPIIRYETVAEQIMGRRETFTDFSHGVTRFLYGLSKKILLANNFALLSDNAFNMLGYNGLSVAYAWMGALAYAFQIYFDFSGYSDMAIGLGKMFGFHFPENFSYPYISRSISEFWRRWHISLGSWFREYVYIPLGGSRVSSSRRLLLNLLIVWGLTGLWHGANWTFISWGLLYFVLIAGEKVTNFEKKIIPLADRSLLISILTRSYTLLMVLFGWVLFRAESITDALSYLKIMLFLSEVPAVNFSAVMDLKENAVFFFFGILFSMPVARRLSAKFDGRFEDHLGGRLKPADLRGPAVLMVLFVISMAYLVKGAYNPFIYFNF
jgi:alginate O-acetyltransferase complex protein AlgI